MIFFEADTGPSKLTPTCALLDVETASIAGVLGGAFAAAAQAISGGWSPFGSSTAVLVAATGGLVVGCCCGLGWGLLLGSSSPRLASRLVRIFAALAAEAAAPAPAVAFRAPAPRPVRRPAFLEEA